MEFLNNLKQKIQSRREQEAKRMASSFITLSDYDGKLYISFQGNPLMDINENMSTSDILSKLKEIRDNYIYSKLND